MHSKRRGFPNYANFLNKRNYKNNKGRVSQYEGNNRKKYYINDYNYNQKWKKYKKNYYYYYNNYNNYEHSVSNYSENVNNSYEEHYGDSDYEGNEFKDHENKIKENRIGFKDVKESTLKKFYEEHYEDLLDKIKNKQNDLDTKAKLEEINIDDIKNKCKEKKYVITENDKAMLENMRKEERSNNVEYYNKYMFYTKMKKSIYVPHILKSKKDISSIYLDDKKLKASDFQINEENNNLFYTILLDKLIIINSDTYDKNKTYKEFGITTSKDDSIGILYTTIDENFLRGYLLKEGLNENIIFGSVSKFTKISPTDFNIEDINTNYTKGLSNEELILLNIYEKLGQENIIKYPRLLLYESNCFINGQPVLKYILPGFQEVDCIMKSKITMTLPSIDTPFYLQKEYQIKNISIEEVSFPSISLTIDKNKIYMFEIKSSFPKNLIDIMRKMIKNVVTFRRLFIKEQIIEKNDIFEVIIIYDSHRVNISTGISKLIGLNELYGELDGMKIKIVYCKPIFAMCALFSLQSKIHELEIKIDDLQNKIKK